MREREPRFGDSLSSYEVNQVVMIPAHPVQRGGLPGHQVCDSIVARITSVYLSEEGTAMAVAQCESCSHAEHIDAS